MLGSRAAAVRYELCGDDTKLGYFQRRHIAKHHTTYFASKPLTPGELLVYLELADGAHENPREHQGRTEWPTGPADSCTWPSIKTLEALTGLHEATVKRATASLKKRGCIIKVGGERAKWIHKQAVVYVILPPPPRWRELRAYALIQSRTDGTPDEIFDRYADDVEAATRAGMTYRKYGGPTLTDLHMVEDADAACELAHHVAEMLEMEFVRDPAVEASIAEMRMAFAHASVERARARVGREPKEDDGPRQRNFKLHAVA